MRSTLARILLVLLALSAAIFATPGVDRVLRKTDHFELLIDRTQAPRLDTLAGIAETAWERLAATTGYKPKERIRIVFHDQDDYANGWAFPANNWANIWLSPMPFDLRGGGDWLRNVLSHELAHIFTLRALGLDGHLVSVGVAGGLDRENFSGSADLRWTFNDLESWLTEGLAQVGAEFCLVDSWDAHRDMLERVAWKSGRTLPDGLSRTFWGDSRESELVYNQGFSFVRWVLLNSQADLALLLREGRRKGLRKAIETATGKPFPQVLEAWKSDLAERHGASAWPDEPGRPLAPVDAASTWISETSVVGDSFGRAWVVSSRANDYGVGSLWEFREGRARKIRSDAVGRLGMAVDGKRLVVLREETGMDRRTIRDLWTYAPDSRDWKRLTVRARVQDAGFHPEGFVAIVRRDGANRPVVLDPVGQILSRLPVPSGMDLVQIASSPDGEVVATGMDRRGYRLLRLSGEAWEDVPGIVAQARDPVFARGRLWYSRLGDGRWEAYSTDSTGIESFEAGSEGAVFAPWPVDDDSLVVSRYQRQGFVAAKVARRIPSNTASVPAMAKLDPDTAAPVSRVVATRKGDPLEIGSLAGYGFVGGLVSQRDPSSVFNPGTKWLLAGGVYTTTSTMETSLQADMQILQGGPGQRAGRDLGFAITASTEAWSPILSVSLATSQLTLENEGKSDSAIDTFFVDGKLPFLTTTQAQASVVQMLSSRSYAYALLDMQKLGIGVRGLTGDISLDLQKTTQLVFGWGRQDFEPGRFGPLSGNGVSFLAGRLWNAVLEEIGFMPDAWVAQGQLSLAANVRRRLLLGAGVSGTWMAPDRDEGRAMANTDLSVGIPLPIPAFGVPLTRHWRWTFVDPIVRFGQFASFEPASMGIDEYRVRRVEPANFGRVGFRPRPVAGLPTYRATDELEIHQVASAQLDWKVITLSNLRTTWSIGVDLPSLDANIWSQAKWRASISL